MISFSLCLGASVVVEENLACHAACSAWEKAVDEELFQKVTWDEMPNPEAREIQDGYSDAFGGKTDDNWDEVYDDACCLPKPESSAFEGCCDSAK